MSKAMTLMREALAEVAMYDQYKLVRWAVLSTPLIERADTETAEADAGGITFNPEFITGDSGLRGRADAVQALVAHLVGHVIWQHIHKRVGEEL